MARRYGTPILACALVVALTSPANAADVYVSPAGSDAGSFCSAQSPCRTIEYALQRIPEGGDVFVAPGRYPFATDTVDHAATATVHLAGAVLEGFNARDATNVALLGGKVAGFVRVDNGSRNVLVQPDEIDGAGTAAAAGRCFTVRGTSSNVTLRNAVVRNCDTGAGGPNGGDPNSTEILIDGVLFEDMQQDGIQMTDWTDVTIKDTTFRRIRDTVDDGVDKHNDAIQTAGNVQQLRIINTVLSGYSATESSSAVRLGAEYGPVDDVLIVDPVVGRTGSDSIVSGATKTKIVGGAGCDDPTTSGIDAVTVNQPGAFVIGGLWSSIGGLPQQSVGNVIGCP